MTDVFESSVEAAISGDTNTLARLLREHPNLVRARSSRPHHASLLHYMAANGVENERQKNSANALEIARMLLDSGAEVDALADMYDGRHTTMTMLVSSVHPAKAGVQDALVELLLDFGAAIEGIGSGTWGTPLMTALAFGYPSAAATLVRRGAKVDNFASAAGLGRLAQVTELLSTSDAEERHRAIALAAQHGHAEIVELLLKAGEDPTRLNPKGFHGHSTPLHQAVIYGHTAVVRLLAKQPGTLQVRDSSFQGTPLDWAKHAGHVHLEQYLR